MPIIQPTPIDQLPQPPNPADRSNFNSLAYPFTAAMLPLTEQINQAISDMYNNALEAEAKAGEAEGSATAAAGSATAANTAKTGAEAAKTAAETARNGAQSSATAAANSATAANTAKAGAEAARDAAAQSATDAAQSAADAAGVVLGNFGPAIHAAAAKGAPADADELAVADSQASWSLKKLTWSNLKAAIWAAFKTIATGGSAKDTLGLGTAATHDVGSGDEEIRQNSGNDERFVAKSQIKATTGQSAADIMSQKAVTDAINAAVANIDVSGPRPVKDHGAVATAGSQTVVCNVQESDFHIMSMETANTTGTLTIDFANMPDTVGKHFSWHVRLRRGGRKTVAFAQTVTWAGNVKPNFGTGTNSHDLIMFYKVDNETIRAMVIDAWG